jgi:hypothetical protein
MYNTDSQILDAQVIINDTNTITSSTSGGLIIEGGLATLDTYVSGHVAVNDVKITPNPNDILYERELELTADTPTFTSISDLFFINPVTNGFKLKINVISNKNTCWEITGVLVNNEWSYNASYTGNPNPDVDFRVLDVTLDDDINIGQVQYINNNNVSVVIRYRAETLAKQDYINVSTQNILTDDKINSLVQGNFYYADAQNTFDKAETIKYINDNFSITDITSGNIQVAHITSQIATIENDNFANLTSIQSNTLLADEITTSNLYVENITTNNLISNKIEVGDINVLTPAWATRIGSAADDRGLSIDVSKIDESVYVTGYFSGGNIYNADDSIFTTFGSLGNIDVFIVKYNSVGFAQWATRVGGVNSDVSNSISLSSINDNIYITGQYFSNSLTVYNSDGSTFGSLVNTTSGTSDAFLIKYDNSGIAQWATRLGAQGNVNGYSLALSSDSDNIYITGTYSRDLTLYNSDNSTFGTMIPSSSTIGNGNVFIAKYNNSGFVQWATRIGSVGQVEGHCIAISPDNQSIYVGGRLLPGTMTLYNSDGSSGGSLSNQEPLHPVGQLNHTGYIAKYDANGNFKWVVNLFAGSTHVKSLCVDNDGNIYATGAYRFSTLNLYNSDNSLVTLTFPLFWQGNNDIFIVKYNSLGFLQWATRAYGLGSPITQASDFSYSIALLPNQDICIAGTYRVGSLQIINSDGTLFYNNPESSTGSNQDAIIIIYDSNGMAKNVARVGNTDFEEAFGISVSLGGNIYITGYYNSILSAFNSDNVLINTIGNTGNNDAFVVKYVIDTNNYYDLNIRDQLYITGDTEFNGLTSLHKTLTINNNLIVTNGSTFNATGSIIIGSLYINELLNFNLTATFNNNVNIENVNVNANAGLSVDGNSNINGQVDINNNVGLFIGGSSTLDGQVDINELIDGLNWSYYQAYFNDNVNFFNTAAHFSRNGIATTFTNLTNSTNNVSLPQLNSVSIQWLGFFKPDISGDWTFFTNSDDASYVWIGETALSGYTTTNALVNNGGLHGMQIRSGTINLVENTFYPIRIQYGNNTGPLGFEFYFTPPDSSTDIFNGTGYLFTNINSINALNVTGGSTLAGLTSINRLNVTGNLSVSGNTTLRGDVTIGNSLDISNTLTLTGLSTLLGSVDINNNLDINNTLTVTSASTFNAGVNILNRLVVTGGTVFINDLTTGSINVNGNIFATGSISQSSDIRLKTDISTIDSALDKINELRGVYYTHRDSDKRSVGVIAQETELVLPEVVREIGEYKYVEYGNIYGLLIEAVKELDKQINSKLEKFDDKLNLM